MMAVPLWFMHLSPRTLATVSLGSLATFVACLLVSRIRTVSPSTRKAAEWGVMVSDVLAISFSTAWLANKVSG